MWGFCLLFLAMISVTQTRMRRQRIGKVELTQQDDGDPMESDQAACDCPFPLLPWTLLTLLGMWTLYFMLTRKQRGVDPRLEQDAVQERALLRDVTSVLNVIRPRLWKIAQTQRKQHHPSDESDIKGH